jgi:hypothetical protein
VTAGAGAIAAAPARPAGVAGLAVLLAAMLAGGCAFPVQGAFVGRALPERIERAQAIVVIYNHGFSTELAGRYQPRLPPILDAAQQRNADVVVFSQVRNTVRLEAVHHGSYVESAVQHFERLGVPRGNIILAGQSCGGWGSLQAAAHAYPDVGGVVAFAPTCHGRRPHSAETRRRRRDEIARLGHRAVFQGVIFLYEGDSYYDLEDWSGFAGQTPLRVERLSRDDVLHVCGHCGGDSHGAVWATAFGAAYYDSHLQPLIERVRARIRSRDGE